MKLKTSALTALLAVPALANTTFDNTEKFAWGANTGWISFRHDQPVSPAGVVFGGAFLSGYAWAANTGWINLGTGMLTTQSMSDVDSDNDGIPDWWEMLHFNNLTTANATSDNDGDGVSDLHEYLSGTDPNDADNYLRVVSHSHDLDITETTLEFTTTPTRLYRIYFSDDLGIDD